MGRGSARARERYLELLDTMGYDIAMLSGIEDLRCCIARTMYAEGFTARVIATTIMPLDDSRMDRIKEWLVGIEGRIRDRARAQL